MENLKNKERKIKSSRTEVEELQIFLGISRYSINKAFMRRRMREKTGVEKKSPRDDKSCDNEA